MPRTASRSTPTASGGTPKVYGLGAMQAFTPLKSNGGTTSSEFYLAQIDKVHAGKTVEISLWDPGDTTPLTASIEIEIPNGAELVDGDPGHLHRRDRHEQQRPGRWRRRPPELQRQQADLGEFGRDRDLHERRRVDDRQLQRLLARRSTRSSRTTTRRSPRAGGRSSTP